jgi:signal transduction histidine kinase
MKTESKPRFALTFRLKLALVYCAMFLLAGTVLLALNYSLLRYGLEHRPAPPPRPKVNNQMREKPKSQAPAYNRPVTPQGILRQQIFNQTLNLLVSQSVLALAILTIPVFVLAYLIAGWSLKPLRRVTETARTLSEHNLEHRLRLNGPKDELQELADTFDTMLERLETTFRSMKQFSANAAHELRTPLTVIQTEVEVTLADPEASNAELRQMGENVQIASQRADRLVNSLLLLARSQGQQPHLEPIGLNELVLEVLEGKKSQIRQANLELRTQLQPSITEGDRLLLEQLIDNLLENAIKYNVPTGWIELNTFSNHYFVRIQVRNSGQVVPPKMVNTLFEPFKRLGVARTRSERGVGLGLAIVQAIVVAHHGTIQAIAQTSGGLEVRIDLPLASRRTDHDQFSKNKPVVKIATDLTQRVSKPDLNTLKIQDS